MRRAVTLSPVRSRGAPIFADADLTDIAESAGPVRRIPLYPGPRSGNGEATALAVDDLVEHPACAQGDDLLGHHRLGRDLASRCPRSTSARRWSILSDRCMPSAPVSGFWRLRVACARHRSRNQRGCQAQVREACVRCPLFLVRAVTAIMGTVVGVTFLCGFGNVLDLPPTQSSGLGPRRSWRLRSVCPSWGLFSASGTRHSPVRRKQPVHADPVRRPERDDRIVRRAAEGSHGGRSPVFDIGLYKRRNVVERASTGSSSSGTWRPAMPSAPPTARPNWPSLQSCSGSDDLQGGA
jgi:hypothetical protein